jgi:hypothetical protein
MAFSFTKKFPKSYTLKIDGADLQGNSSSNGDWHMVNVAIGKSSSEVAPDHSISFTPVADNPFLIGIRMISTGKAACQFLFQLNDLKLFKRAPQVLHRWRPQCMSSN